MTGCSICDQPSVARFSLAYGCQAFPDLHEQELCAQHLSSVEPIGEPMVTLAIHHQGWYDRILNGIRS